MFRRWSRNGGGGILQPQDIEFFAGGNEEDHLVAPLPISTDSDSAHVGPTNDNENENNENNDNEDGHDHTGNYRNDSYYRTPPVRSRRGMSSSSPPPSLYSLDTVDLPASPASLPVAVSASTTMTTTTTTTTSTTTTGTGTRRGNEAEGETAISPRQVAAAPPPPYRYEITAETPYGDYYDGDGGEDDYEQNGLPRTWFNSLWLGDAQYVRHSLFATEAELEEEEENRTLIHHRQFSYRTSPSPWSNNSVTRNAADVALSNESIPVRKQYFARLKKIPLAVIAILLVQLGGMIGATVRNYQLFDEGIEKDPFNYMLGPSMYTAIRQGIKHTPCMSDTEFFNPIQCPSQDLVKYPPVYYVDNTTDSVFACGDAERYCGFHSEGDFDQWWRIFTAFVFHTGWLHFIPIAILTYLYGSRIEKKAGPLRFLLLYFSCSLFGTIASTLYNRTFPSGGGSGAVMGFVACHVLDLLLYWKSFSQPHLHAMAFSSLLLAAFVFGLSPWISNYEQIAGLIMGFVAGILFIPDLLLGSYTARRKRLQCMVALPLYVFLLAGAVYLLVAIDYQSRMCLWCTYFECIPHTYDGFVQNWCII